MTHLEQAGEGGGGGSSGNKIVFAIKFLVSAGLIAYLCSRFELRLPSWGSATVGWLTLSCLLLLLQPALIAMRWRRLLNTFGPPMTSSEAMRITWISVFANQFLPASVGGDVVRVLISRRKGWLLSDAIMSILFDRGLALLGLFILIALLGPFLVGTEQRQVAFFLIGGLAIVGVVGLGFTNMLLPAVQRWASGRASLHRYVSLLEKLQVLLRSPSTLAVALGLSIAVHLLSFFALAAIAYSFGVRIPLFNLLALGGLITLAHILPISIAGWGVRDAATVLLLSTSGVETSVALSISVLLGVGYAVASIPGALFWLLGVTWE